MSSLIYKNKRLSSQNLQKQKRTPLKIIKTFYVVTWRLWIPHSILTLLFDILFPYESKLDKQVNKKRKQTN